MCHELFITATHPPRELIKTKWVTYEPAENSLVEAVAPYFIYDYNYHIRSKTGCGCAFRYWDYELGFHKPQKWKYEYYEDLLGAKALYHSLLELFPQNTKMVLIPSWNAIEDIPTTHTPEIQLAEISEREFVIFTDKLMNLVI
jgi:hypothetical protein